MLTSSTGRRVRFSWTARTSMPSSRPQAKMSLGSAAYRAAMSWLNGTPLGVGTTSLAGRSPPGCPPSRPAISSRASPQTSGFITMPGPPPNGTSSTVRWTSVAQRRRSCTRNSMSPRATAFPISETRSGLSKYSGKIVTISMRSPTPAPFFQNGPGPEPRPLVRLRRVKQSRWRVDDENAGADIDLGHDGLHERHQVLARLTPVLIPVLAHDEQVLAVVQHVSDDPHRVASRCPDRQPDQLVVTELVRVRGFGQLARIHAQPAAGQLPGRGPVRDPA